MNNSIAMSAPIELINITPFNPLISKCQIKVCWVGDEPNPNGSVINKETGYTLANSLPGSPIVGYFNPATADFEEHNKIIEIKNGKFELKPTTTPYGFVDLNAPVWFQKFSDNGVEREYLVTEGWLWTGQFPECQRIIDKGNNQSMELDEEYLDAHWSNDVNGYPEFFIINEAIISKLCILGEEFRPCFEGAEITAPKIEFSLGDDFKEQLFSMMREIKTILSEGGKKVFTQYAIEIGDSLYRTIRAYLCETYPNTNDECDWRCSDYYIHSIYEEGDQKFAILCAEDSDKLYRMNFVYSEDGFTAEALVEVEANYVPVENSFFSLDATKEFEAKEKEEKLCPECGKPLEECTCEEDKKKKEEEEFTAKTCPKCGKPLEECECEDAEDDEDKKVKYILEEIPEYMDLSAKFSALETELNDLKATYEALKADNDSLAAFKLNIERQEKETMIEQFYMLSDEDKADVKANIDTYSLEDIEAKLSVICVRNKVSFNLEDDKEKDPLVYSFKDQGSHTDSVPEWIRAIQAVAENY